MDHSENIHKLYGNKLRLRVCGICLDEQDRVLMVRHKGLGEEGELWIPPGGGMEWGQSAPDNLKREFLEETGLEVTIGDFLFVHEHQQASLHSVELFFRVYPKGGTLTKGFDPEMLPHQQIISEVRFFHFSELQEVGPRKLHAIFRNHKNMDTLINAKGYFKFEK